MPLVITSQQSSITDCIIRLILHVGRCPILVLLPRWCYFINANELLSCFIILQEAYVVIVIKPLWKFEPILKYNIISVSLLVYMNFAPLIALPSVLIHSPIIVR